MKNKEEFSIDLREFWQIVSLQDFVDNTSEELSLEKWLKEQGFDKESSYLEINIKIKARWN